MKNWLQKRLINWIVHDLFNTVDKNDILNRSGTTWYMGEKKLSQEQIERFKENAATFKDSVFWLVLRNEIKYHANQRMYNKSVTTDDILAGKMMLYVVEVIDNTLIDILK